MKKTAAVILAAVTVFCFLVCKNPMVNYLLGDEEREHTFLFDVQNPVALMDGVWYYSLHDAIDAAARAASQTIYLRRNITSAALMGADGLVIPADKDITIKPYTQDIAEVVIRRWKDADVLLTVESGGKFSLHKSVRIDGGNSASGSPLLMLKSGGAFTMQAGSKISGGRVYVAYNAATGTGASFVINGTAANPTCVSDGEVFLETGALITLAAANVGVNPIACITPAQYRPGIQVIEGVTPAVPPALVPEVASNNRKFDVTPEDAASGWAASRFWRVDEQGRLGMVIARRFDSGRGETLYYSDLQNAFNEAGKGEVVLLANIALEPSVEIYAGSGSAIRLSVPEKESFTIRRTAAALTVAPAVETAAKSVFSISPLASLELACPEGSALNIDGGAVWAGGNPASDTRQANVGRNGIIVNSTRPLVYVSGGGVLSGTFRLGRGVTLCNNDRIAGDGGGVESDGHFYMSGGTITRNRAQSGGGVYFKGDYDPLAPPAAPPRVTREISGGSISENDALLCGGGIMLDLSGWSKVTMKGGEIRGNRANGKYSAGISADFDGYGGGVFIPGAATIENAFSMEGGVISGNVSASGQGNGVAIDRQRHPPPVFALRGKIEIAHNDIHLRYYDAYNFPESYITLTGNLEVQNPIPLTMNRYPANANVNSYKNYQKVVGPDSSALAAANYTCFTVPAPYQIQSTGRLHTP